MGSLNGEHYADCYDALCECGRGTYHCCTYASCYDCYLDRLADYAQCIYCDRWHSPEFDTCFQCSLQGRDEATRDLKLVILGRDGFKCRYCGVTEGVPQCDPRLLRPKCPAGCVVPHNHQFACKERCARKHKHRNAGDYGICQPGCTREHGHLAKDDDGVRPARLHIDHIMPCAKGGTADPWNLQVLCGVCNISKGSDWLPFGRHAEARKEVIAAYATYLLDFLTEEERERLSNEQDAMRAGWDPGELRSRLKDDYIRRVKSRPRRRAPHASPGILAEDLPSGYTQMELATAANGDGRP